MREFFNFYPKKIILLIALILLVLIALFALTLKKPKPTPSPSPTPLIVSPLEKTRIGETVQKQVEEGLKFSNKQLASKSGAIVYSIPSVNPLRPDEVRTQNGKVNFERINLPEETQAVGYLQITNFQNTHGQAEKVIKGSEFYGPFISYYIYAKKGITIIGNSHTDEVYELQRYQPMTVEEYLEKYGQDVKEGEPAKEDPGT